MWIIINAKAVSHNEPAGRWKMKMQLLAAHIAQLLRTSTRGDYRGSYDPSVLSDKT